MPKHLFICRHADTAPAQAGQLDFDRPLTPQGVEDARKAANWILQTGIPVSTIMCSAAVRTQSTARIFAEVLQVDAAAIFPDQQLYHASARELENHIGQLPASQQVALLVGHNPAVSQLVAKFNSLPGHYVPTSGVNLFTFNTDDWLEIDWSDFHWQPSY